MFDEQGKALVLEANANPSMAYDAIHTLEALSSNITSTAGAATAAATAAASSAAAGHVAAARVPSDASEAASYAASLDQRGASGVGRGDALAHRQPPLAPSLAAAAAVVSGGMMKAGGAEGRRRRQEEEARLAQVALGLDSILPPLPEIPLMEEATALCKGRGVKLCRCLIYTYIYIHILYIYIYIHIHI
jgi:hypothetical protein